MEVNGNSQENILERGAGSSRFNLIFAVVAGYSLHICTGSVIAWPSPIIPRIGLTSEQNSLVSSLFALGALPGQIITSVGIDTIGRKGVLYALGFTFLLSWVLLLASRDIIVIYIARLVGGMGVGGAFTAVSLYVAEIADEKLRSSLGSILQIFLALGILVEYCVGPYVSYTVLSIVSLVLVLIFGSMFYFAPESPHYLVAKDNITEAYKAIKWLRGGVSDEDIKEEISKIQVSIKKEKESSTGIRKLCTSKAVHKGLGIAIFLIVLQQGTAINGILAYVEYIFEHAKLNVPSEIVPMLVGFIHLFSSLPVLFFVRKVGSKIVFVVSTLGSGLSLILLGVYFYLLRHDYDTTHLWPISVISIIFFNVFFCIGLGPVLWGYIAELYAPSVKGMALGICGIFQAAYSFGVIQLFSTLLQDYGIDDTFLGFGCFLTIGSILCFFIVPDTSRLSFSEIQDLLSA